MEPAVFRFLPHSSLESRLDQRKCGWDEDLACSACQDAAMVKADAAAKRIALAKEEIQRWNKDVQKDKAAHNQRNQLINFG